MKTKKLLFGLIGMNRIMYNILYTLLCVCVLLIILILSAYGLTELEDTGVITEPTWTHVLLVNGLLIFIGDKLMDKKHYA
jgi:hypothetical protein